RLSTTFRLDGVGLASAAANAWADTACRWAAVWDEESCSVAVGVMIRLLEYYLSRSHRLAASPLDQCLGGTQIFPGREQNRWVVETVGQEMSQSRRLLSRGQQGERGVGWRLQHGVGPAHHQIGVIPVTLERFLHPVTVKRAFATLQDAVQIHL